MWKVQPQKQIHIQGSHSDWKTWENVKTFSNQGKVSEFLTDWENQTKYWKTYKCYLLFLVIFKLTVLYLLKWIKFLV